MTGRFLAEDSCGRIPPDTAQAVKSLTWLEAISADYVLPGHGDPWTGGVQEALQQIRRPQDRSG